MLGLVLSYGFRTFSRSVELTLRMHTLSLVSRVSVPQMRRTAITSEQGCLPFSLSTDFLGYIFTVVVSKARRSFCTAPQPQPPRSKYPGIQLVRPEWLAGGTRGACGGGAVIRSAGGLRGRRRRRRRRAFSPVTAPPVPYA